VRTLVDSRLPRRAGYLLLSLPLGVLYFSVLLAGFLAAASSAFFVGIPLAMGLMLLWRRMAGVERGLHARLLDAPIEPPYRPLTEPKRLGRMRERATDRATWKDLGYLVLAFPMGIVSFSVVVLLAGLAIGFATMPAWWYVVPDGVEIGAFLIDGWGKAIAAVPLAVPTFLLLALAVRWLAAMHVAAGRALLARGHEVELEATVTELQDSRARIIAAADGERRRLERDLHDGAQQRLVAVSMTLGMAKRRMAKGEDVSSLVVGADDELKAAIAELRDLARGIHPAVLTDRGLAAAVRDLAARASVPVELGALPEDRLPVPVEAAAYFTVSEALTNVAKYAQAGQARVDVARVNGHLTIAVADDGVGGAAPEGGSGLRGLADRLGALGGDLHVESPHGGGTTLRARIPVHDPTPEPAADDPTRVAIGRRRWARRALASHAVVYGIVMALLVFIWLTTGGGYFWPQWPIVGWGSLLAIHAWFAEGRHAGMLAPETQADR
jgi:signal transduction histidine kinase